MSFQVMHGHQRKIETETQSLGVVDPNQERSDQSGALSYRNAIQIPRPDSGVPQGGPDDRGYVFEVPSGRQLGDHSSISLVDILLRGHDIGEDSPPVLQDGGCCLIAGRFNAKGQHGRLFLNRPTVSA